MRTTRVYGYLRAHEHDADGGVRGGLRRSALGALLESDAPPPMQVQPMASHRRWRAVCGTFGQTTEQESGVTCEACRKALTRRAKEPRP